MLRFACIWQRLPPDTKKQGSVEDSGRACAVLLPLEKDRTTRCLCHTNQTRPSQIHVTWNSVSITPFYIKVKS